MIALSLSTEEAQLVLTALRSKAQEIYNEANVCVRDGDLLKAGDRYQDLANVLEETLICHEPR